jgi:hypothetical protein
MTNDKPKRTASQIGASNCATAKNHERRVADLFTSWSGHEFRRRRVTGRDMATLWVDSAADVIPTTTDFPFSIEAKKGKNFSMDALLANPTNCLFEKWWFQTCYDANLISNLRGSMIYPLLMFKPEPAYDWMAISTRALPLMHPKPELGVLKENDELWFPHYKFTQYSRIGQIEGDVSHSKKHPQLVKLTLDDLCLCRWRDFAANVDPTPLVTAKPNLPSQIAAG